MKKYILTVILIILYNKTQAQTGINTNTPTKTMDVNGEVRIRTIPATGSAGKSILTSDPDGNLYKLDNIAAGKIGDVKSSLAALDHSGWYLMNGRNISTLPVNARNNAIGIGISTAIPNAADRMVRTIAAGQTVGTVSGSNSIILTPANIPAYTLAAATLNPSGAHAHSVTDFYTIANGFGIETGAGYWFSLTSRVVTTAVSGSHNHSVAAATGGSSQPLNILPEYLVVNTFIYLGQ
ncbi:MULTISPECIES: hypothetical protein [Chryseobacterium]|uniref:Microcystin-dependent protein n=1 Tax=Chryseobacterium geocarposphaerae TaxID=1416776 RepID=A0ABU1L8V3_9FLAO|nr:MULTISPECIES: hypothetical protein [Chryseobacterium]MDR6403144.1 microcystin-dependent protein [Chryseobacterium geocarposphaerae]MDR6696699.1 microcystin-dependent protein [Chryseobacterium ginsenosidimutans]